MNLRGLKRLLHTICTYLHLCVSACTILGEKQVCILPCVVSGRIGRGFAAAEERGDDGRTSHCRWWVRHFTQTPTVTLSLIEGTFAHNPAMLENLFDLVDVRNASATKPEDLMREMAKIEGDMGFEAVNSLARGGIVED